MTRYTIEFSVDFLMGKQRPRFNGRSRAAYTPSETVEAEYQIGVAYRAASIRRYGRVVRAPRGVPVAVRVDCFKKAPKSMPEYVPKWLRPRIPDTTKPDWDNSGGKLVSDALNGIAWDDDAQVTAGHVFKHDRNGVKHDRMDIAVQFDLEEEEDG